MVNNLKYTNTWQWAISLFTILLYVLLLYFIPRTNFLATYATFILLFGACFFMVRRKQYFSLRFCVALAVILRLTAVFSLPALSDDYFRFIWDGKMFVQHINPFTFTPKEYIALHSNEQWQYLYNNLIPESQESYTVYPAILQYVFSTATALFPKNIYGAVVTMKLFIFSAECLSIYALTSIAKQRKIPVRNILWYALNPLIIVELTGNVHFEALLICFLLLTFYFAERNKIILSAVCWSLAICSKILPIMLAPLFLLYWGTRRFLQLGVLTLLFTIILFIPLIDKQFLLHMGYSIGKYYNLYEFNASFYYLFVKISERISSNDYAEQIAHFLGWVSFAGILMLSFYRFKKELLYERAMLVFFIYFLGAAMVHPWYISTMVALCVFGRYKFPLIFSLLIPLSYYPYWLPVYDENMLVITAEYSLLFLFICFEWKRVNKGNRNILLNEL